MRTVLGETISVGHSDARRTIYDLIKDGDAGGTRPLYNLALFSPLKRGSKIGNHYHLRGMWETYLILSGCGVMHLLDTEDGVRQSVHLGGPGGYETPCRIVIPPAMVHTLVAQTDMLLLIAATAPVTPDNMHHYPLVE